MNQKILIAGLITIVAATAITGTAILISRNSLSEPSSTSAPITQNLAPTPRPVTTNTEPKNPVMVLIPKITSVNGAPNLEVWTRHQAGQASLSAYALRAEVFAQNGINSTTASPTLPQEFKSNNWTYPFAEVSTIPNGLEIKISGIHVSPDDYPINGEVLLFSIPLSDPVNNVTLTIDSSVSQLYDSEAKVMHFTQEDLPIPAEVQ